MSYGRPRAWKKRGHVPVYEDNREAQLDAELETKRFAHLAVRVGWCGACGARVDEDNGVLHDPHCPVEPERKRKE